MSIRSLSFKTYSLNRNIVHAQLRLLRQLLQTAVPFSQRIDCTTGLTNAQKYKIPEDPAAAQGEP